jgi:glutamate racemase
MNMSVHLRRGQYPGVDSDAPIGVFDSGCGGIGVLAECLRVMPSESFVYYGDTANAPYGNRTAADITRLTGLAVDKLSKIGVKALVIACNTVTGAAIADIRRRYTFEIIGIEPAVKPAVSSVGEGRALVLTTAATAAHERFRALCARFDSRKLILSPQNELAIFIEHNLFKPESVSEYLRGIFLPYRGDNVTAVVLGCTHYSLVKPAVERSARAVFGHKVGVFDGNTGIARRAASRVKPATARSLPPYVKILSSLTGCAYLFRDILLRLNTDFGGEIIF